jgi:hypothetical protein
VVILMVGIEEDDLKLPVDSAAWRAAKAPRKGQHDRAILLGTDFDTSDKQVMLREDLGVDEAQEVSTNLSGYSPPENK